MRTGRKSSTWHDLVGNLGHFHAFVWTCKFDLRRIEILSICVLAVTYSTSSTSCHSQWSYRVILLLIRDAPTLCLCFLSCHDSWSQVKQMYLAIHSASDSCPQVNRV
jgi:hypothetical protein